MSGRAARTKERPGGGGAPARERAGERPLVKDQPAGLDGLQQQAGNHAVRGLLESGQDASGGLRAPAQPLDSRTRALMEERLGHDLGSVRVHRGADAEDSAGSLNAEAFTVGDDVVLGAEARASTVAGRGREVLAHELAHVVQQRGPRTGRAPAPSHEAEAEGAGHGSGLVPAGLSGLQRKAKDDEKKEAPGPKPAEPASGKEKQDEPKEKKGSFLGSLWSGIKGAASTVWSGMKTAGEAVWGGAKAAGSAVWEGMKAVGGWVAKGAEKVWAAAKWLGRQLWDKVTGIFARVTRWVAKLPERVGRLFAGLWDGLTSLKPWSLEWWKSLGKVSTWVDFLKWIGARAIDLAEILGVGEIAETAADLIKFNTRTLAAGEISEASSIFGASLDYRLVRIDERAVIGPSFTHREFTSFHTINGWGPVAIDTLIHELTHVWQYEHAGAIYMAQAVHAQAWGEGYTFGGAAGLQTKKTAGLGMASLNREQQAQVVQDFYRLKKGMGPFDPGANPASATDLPLYADFVKEVSTLSSGQLLA